MPSPATLRPLQDEGGSYHQKTEILTLRAAPPDQRIQCQLLRSTGSWALDFDTEVSIAKATVDVIKRAKHFVFIENQFFISTHRRKYKQKGGDARSTERRSMSSDSSASTMSSLDSAKLTPTPSSECGWPLTGSLESMGILSEPNGLQSSASLLSIKADGPHAEVPSQNVSATARLLDLDACVESAFKSDRQSAIHTDNGHSQMDALEMSAVRQEWASLNGIPPRKHI